MSKAVQHSALASPIMASITSAATDDFRGLSQTIPAAQPRRQRTANAGFSLLEVIIATAILAASAMVLTSLLGLGTKYGNRAEERMVSIELAQALMDDFLARPSTASSEDEITGDLPGPPARSFRIRVTPFASSGESKLGQGSSALVQVTVEIFRANRLAEIEQAEPVCRIARLLREHRLHPPESRAELDFRERLP
jgi:prepilin-type N-terminal cleavage/methylation domain-containing protein